MKKNKTEKAFGGAAQVYVAHIEKETIQDKGLNGITDYISRPLTIDGNDAIDYFNATPDFNSYHSRCLRIKTDVTVGLGFNFSTANETALHDRLSAVNEFGESFAQVIGRVGLDYETTGNGYLEVVRGPGGMVNELYFMPSVRVYRRPRGSSSPFYYLDNMKGAMIPLQMYRPGDTEVGSTVLMFQNFTQSSRHYGLPDWRGALPDIELDYYSVLYNKKFFINSGIPDMAIIVEGGQFDEATQSAVKSFLTSNIKGVMNAHRTLYLPINDINVKVRFERLGLDVPKDASFEMLRSRCRDNIVSGHGVYPRLVGIVTAGQLGGGGEAAGQLKTFQEISVAPKQSMYEQKLSPMLSEMGLGEAEIKFEEMDTSIQEPFSTYYPAMINCGVLTVEKSREELGYEIKMIGDEEAAERRQQEQAQDTKTDDEKIAEGLEAISKSLEN